MEHKHLAGDQSQYVVERKLDSYDYLTDSPNGYPLCVSKFEMGMNSLKMTKQIIRQDTYVYQPHTQTVWINYEMKTFNLCVIS